MRKTKPDTSLANKTGHFNLLTTRVTFAQLTDRCLPAPVVRVIASRRRGFFNLSVFLVGQAKSNVPALLSFFGFLHLDPL